MASFRFTFSLPAISQYSSRTPSRTVICSSVNELRGIFKDGDMEGSEGFDEELAGLPGLLYTKLTPAQIPNQPHSY
jgi:hypothetical protein